VERRTADTCVEASSRWRELLTGKSKTVDNSNIMHSNGCEPDTYSAVAGTRKDQRKKDKAQVLLQ
jgi:hypothetical protein